MSTVSRRGPGRILSHVAVYALLPSYWGLDEEARARVANAWRDALAAAAEGVRPPYDWIAPAFFGVGAVVTVVLATLRSLYWWWPLHPLGYALSASWSLIVFWFPILIAWAIKAPLLQYTGVRGYRRFRPFFLGMVFGEFSMAVFWTGVSWLTKVRAPTFPWP